MGIGLEIITASSPGAEWNTSRGETAVEPPAFRDRQGQAGGPPAAGNLCRYPEVAAPSLDR